MAAILVALLVAMPVAAVLASAFAPAGDAWRHIVSTVLQEYAVNSALLVLGVTVIAASAGAISAWLVVAFQFPGRKLAEVALLLPLAMPAYVCGYVYTEMLDVAGPVQNWIRLSFGLRYGDYWFPTIRSLPGAAFVLGLVLYPYVYLLCRAAFLQQSVCLLEVARTLGHGPARTFLHVALPLARPAIAAGIGLALMETLADFGTVQHFGVSTFSTGIYEAWFGMGDRMAASRLAAVMLFAIVLLLAIERLARGPRRFHSTTTRMPPLRSIPLSGVRGVLAGVACLMPVLLGFGIPVAYLLMLAIEVGDPLPFSAFLRFGQHSFILASVTACLAVVLAWMVAWSARHHPNIATRVGRQIASMGYAIPGSVIAVGTLVPFALLDNSIDAWARANLNVSTGLLLSGTIAALVFAYLVRFFSPALSAVDGALGRLKPNLAQSARLLGYSRSEVARKIELPLSRGGLLAAAVLVFVDTMKELPATLIVRPFDFDTLAVRIYKLASDEKLAEASTASLLLVLAGLLPVIVLTRAMHQKNGA